jgi:hypothetical protein
LADQLKVRFYIIQPNELYKSGTYIYIYMNIIAALFNLTRKRIDESTDMSDDEDFNSGNRRSRILPSGSGAHSAFAWLALETFPRRGKVAGT